MCLWFSPQELKRTQTITDDETGLYNTRGSRLRPTLPSRHLDRGIYQEDEVRFPSSHIIITTITTIIMRIITRRCEGREREGGGHVLSLREDTSDST
jgi:hypothetical protein